MPTISIYTLDVLVRARILLIASLCALTLGAPLAQQPSQPTARLVSAPGLVMPGPIDSNVPMTWDLVDGEWKLFALASWGGTPTLLAGSGLDRTQRIGVVAINPPPGYGTWMDSVIADESGT